jgi:hypothetical protein
MSSLRNVQEESPGHVGPKRNRHLSATAEIYILMIRGVEIYVLGENVDLAGQSVASLPCSSGT